jgi:uncharacterized protein (TIGR01777 family)
MKIFVAGGTGFLGRALVRTLVEHGHRCLVLSRRPGKPWDSDAVEMLRGDPTRPGPWQTALGGCDALVNLAGAPIVDPPHRWTDERKRIIRESRIESTRCIGDALRHAQRPPAVFVNASAVGYYGSRADRELDETAPPGNDFLARLCVDWEEAARDLAKVTRATMLRSGIVLGRGGGALQPMLPPFKLGLGGPWGSGTQWWSWIHIEDAVGIILLALERPLPGAVNLVAPNPVTVNDFARTLGDALSRPAFARVPEFALRLALGEAAEALLASQRVVPRRAQDAGYAFRFPRLTEALVDIVGA